MIGADQGGMNMKNNKGKIGSIHHDEFCDVDVRNIV